MRKDGCYFVSVITIAEATDDRAISLATEYSHRPFLDFTAGLDMEKRILERHVEELKAGHIIIAIETPSERLDEAVKIASQNGARRFVHFGLMTVTWLTK